MARKLVSIAFVVRAHGLKGEVRLQPHNEETEVLRRGAMVVLRRKDGTERDVKLSGLRAVDRAFLAMLDGVADRDSAEALKGSEILVPRDQLPPPDEGEFYECDVEGARAELEDGTLVGTVKELRTYPTCSVLVVVRPEGAGEIEVPLVEDYILSVDTEASLVRLRQIDEL